MSEKIQQTSSDAGRSTGTWLLSLRNRLRRAVGVGRHPFVSLPISLVLGWLAAGLVLRQFMATTMIGAIPIRHQTLRYHNQIGLAILIFIMLLWHVSLWPSASRRIVSRCSRFRLRTLFGMVTACAVVCGTIGVRRLDAWRQKTAVQKMDAIPTFDGNDVVDLRFWPNRPNELLDDRLVHLKNLPRLHALSLQYAWVTDAGLAQLAPLEELQELKLGFTAHFDPALNLVEIFGETYHGLDVKSEAAVWSIRNELGSGGFYIRNTHVTDAGMAHVAKVRSLRVLNLDSTAVSDDGLRHLAQLPLLEELDLQRTYVTNEGLRTLATFPRLERLWLGGVRYVTNDGLRHLAQIPTLRELRLPYSATDEVIESLVPLRNNLQRLDVSECQFSERGLEALRTAFSGCEVTASK